MIAEPITLLQLGNPETCDAEDWKGMVDYAWSHAVVSDETHKTIKESCDFYSDDPWSNKDCTQGMAEYYRQYNEIDIYSLYTSVCIPSSEGKKSSLVTVRSSSSKVMEVILFKLHNFSVFDLRSSYLV